MITVSGRTLIIPDNEKTVGCAGDGLVEKRQFQLPLLYGDVDLTNLTWVVETQSGATKNIISLSKATGAHLVLTWEIAESHLLFSGWMYIQLRGYTGTTTKWHSEPRAVYVVASIDAEGSIPDPLPSSFTEMEIRIDAAKDLAVESAKTATEKIQRSKKLNNKNSVCRRKRQLV